MADNLSTEDRKKNMRAIRSTNTKLEEKVCKELWRRGVRFRKNVKDLPGKPDIAIKKYKIVIFLDSCFWHNCPLHGNTPKSNTNYWINKLYRNGKRDYLINQYYYENNWHLIRIWEHQVHKDFKRTMDGLTDFIKEVKNTST